MGLILVSAVLVAVITVVDVSGATVYLWRWLLTVMVAALAIGGAVVSRKLSYVFVVIVVVAWMLALPHFRWSTTKSFYMDCSRIRAGMSLAEARQLMAAYRLQREHEGEELGGALLEQPHLTFHPSVARSSDWCVVYIDREGGRVVAAEAIPD